MKFIADLHIHSKYSRATARNLDFEHLYQAARIKGISVVGTGDFTFPAWVDEIESKLEEAEPGLFALKKGIAEKIDADLPKDFHRPVRFMLQTEISNIYKKNGRVRKNHNLVFFPGLDSVRRFNARLDTLGNIRSDGRPILGMDAADLLSLMLDIDDRGFFVPAHIWTPWFSMFGSKSGFDSMQDCFGGLTSHIFAVETGLSSDPPMNWRIQDLDGIRLISNSDAHSPGYLGRNATVFNTDLSFFHIRNALAGNDADAFQGTLDMFPHQGKYHYDGHRKCHVSLNPSETTKLGGICPVCGRPVTLGVLNRVQELAVRPEGYVPENRHGFHSIIPLADIFSEILDVGPRSKKVTEACGKAITRLGPELDILVDRSADDIEKEGMFLLAEAIRRMRSGKIQIQPGYDGEYGRVSIFTAREKQELTGGTACLFAVSDPGPKSVPLSESRQPAFHKRPVSKPPAGLFPGPGGHDLLAGLNPDQLKAVESSARAMIIQAGPGTGKTRTLTARIAYLISEKGVDPGAVLALTFTNKAAGELKDRLSRHLKDRSAGVSATTFHAFCLKLLQQYQGFDGVLVDDVMREDIIRQILGKTGKLKDIRETGRRLSFCLQNLLGPNDSLETVTGPDTVASFRKIYREYDSLCAELNVVDFEGLIFSAVRMLTQDEEILADVRRQFPYIFVDEYQDLNFGQYELVKWMSADAHITVIGDPDQSIYGFRGSDNRYFKQFAEDFPGCDQIRLVRNYRSDQVILDASFQVIRKSCGNDEPTRIYSDIHRRRKLIVKETLSEKEEAVVIGKMIEKWMGGTSFLSMDAGKADLDIQKEYGFSDFAVLFRTRGQSEIFGQVFEKAGIPFQTADKYQWLEVDGTREIVNLCRIMTGRNLWHTDRTGLPKDRPRMEIQTLKKEMAGFGIADGLTRLAGLTGLDAVIRRDRKTELAFDRLLALAGAYANLTDFMNHLALNQDPDTLAGNIEKVSLLTLHSAKGLEFPVVFVAGCEQGLIPFARDGEHVEELNEERRLFYVAMTRAMDILCLTHARKRTVFGHLVQRRRSMFIDDIEKDLTRLEKSAVRPADGNRRPRQMELF